MIIIAVFQMRQHISDPINTMLPLSQNTTTCPAEIHMDSATQLPSCPTVIYQHSMGLIINTADNFSNQHIGVSFYKETMFPYHVFTGDIWRQSLIIHLMITVGDAMRHTDFVLDNDPAVNTKPLHLHPEVGSLHITEKVKRATFSFNCSIHQMTVLQIRGKWVETRTFHRVLRKSAVTVGKVCIRECAPYSTFNCKGIQCGAVYFQTTKCQEIQIPYKDENYKGTYNVLTEVNIGLMNCYKINDILSAISLRKHEMACGHPVATITLDRSVFNFKLIIDRINVPFKEPILTQGCTSEREFEKGMIILYKTKRATYFLPHYPNYHSDYYKWRSAQLRCSRFNANLLMLNSHEEMRMFFRNGILNIQAKGLWFSSPLFMLGGIWVKHIIILLVGWPT